MAPAVGADRASTAVNHASGLPDTMEGARVRVRGWVTGDASQLHGILAENQTHLVGWIPTAIAQLEPVEALERRLTGFHEDAVAGIRDRRAIIERETNVLLGGLDLFGRTATGRVPFAEADRVEIGYWIRRDATGQGLVTEAVQLLLQQLVPRHTWSHAVIRCDSRNMASRRVAERLGFRLVSREPQSAAEPASATHDLETWVHPLPFQDAVPPRPHS